jgi:alkylresorcinol/alkylpyrone synthase
MHISAAASAFPDHYYTQQQILDELASYWSEQSDRLPALNRFHHRVGVDGRYLALPIGEYKAMDRWGQANDVWLKVAEELGSKAICGALKQAGLPKEAIAALISVSVTGIASPSLDAHLVNFMGLPTNIRRVPIFGLGCVAGAAGLAQAAEYVRAYSDRMAVLLSVELCSLTWQREDLSIANLIASGLFGDGAAAVLVTGSDFDHGSGAPTGPEILGSQSSFYPGTEDTMGWDISEKGFQIVLSSNVPQVIKENLPRDVDGFLAKHDLTRDDIGSWVLHTGGPKILEATAAALELPPEACQASWDCLRRVGNLSSTSVLLVLEDVMQNRRPAPGTYGILAAMGPGFCSELVLLRWGPAVQAVTPLA